MEAWKVRLQARKRAGLTQADVGARFKPSISRVAVSLWEKPVERGGTAPEGKRIHTLCTLYGLTAGQLLGHEAVDMDRPAIKGVGAASKRRLGDQASITVGGKTISLGEDPEEGLLELFRGLSQESQDEVIGRAQRLWVEENKEKTSRASPFKKTPRVPHD